MHENQRSINVPRGVEERYQSLQFLGEGTFGDVYKAKDLVDNQIYAIKKIKVEQGNRFGLDISALREIRLLAELHHENILGLIDVFSHSKSTPAVSLVLELMESDLKKIIDNPYITLSGGDIKSFMLQSLLGLEYLHSRWILHRDLKPDNLLVSSKGILKLADFGLARVFGTLEGHYSPNVVTRWYRAPELCFKADIYGTGVDIWSLGCVFYELIKRQPLFPSDSEIGQLKKIFDVVGFPDENAWPGVSILFKRTEKEYKNLTKNNFFYTFEQLLGGGQSERTSLLEKMLKLDPNKRPSATQCLQDAYFSNAPAPTPPQYLPGTNETMNDEFLEKSYKQLLYEGNELKKEANVDMKRFKESL